MGSTKGNSYAPCTETPAVADAVVLSVASSDGSCSSPTKLICHFSCKICYELAEDPVYNAICGHLFCWSCLYKFWTCPKRRQEGRRKVCPYCNCHMDISAGALTVFPLYSGHVPGEVAEFVAPVAKVEDKRLYEEAPENQTDFVPPRRAWHSHRYFDSPSDCVRKAIVKFKLARHDFRRNFYYLFRSVPPDPEDISYTQDIIDELIQGLQRCRRWLTGNEYVGHPNTGKDVAKETGVLHGEEEPRTSPRREEQEMQIAWSPKTNDFSTNLSCFSCEICKDIAFEPVVTLCGHLYCWVCLYHEGDGSSRCRVCDKLIQIYPSRNNINPIYCERNELHREDVFLKSRRRNEKDKQVPCRLLPTVAAPFMDYMIEEVSKLVEAIMTELTDLEHKLESKEAIENITSSMKNQWDDLFKIFLTKWRVDSHEQTPEVLIEPTLLDFEYQKVVESETKERTIYRLVAVITDIFDDTSTKYQPSSQSQGA